MAADRDPARRLPRILRIARLHPRLLMGAVIAVGMIALLPADWGLATKLISGWDAGVLFYLVLALVVVSRSDVAGIRKRAAEEDEGRFAILTLTTAAALSSLGAILAELGASKSPPHLALAAATILLSWFFIQTIFALHYAHEYYGHRGKGSGLTFPGNQDPDYWDFVYFSLVIGMTSQVSDVAVTGKEIRRTVSAHGVVAFIFNTSLLALTVNIAASVI